MSAWRLSLALLLVACGGAAADHERLGDQAYASGRLGEALQEYREAASEGRTRVYAKLGQAALRTGDLREAGEAYRRLGQEDPPRVAEAANGLERVAHAADRANDLVALRAAFDGLRTLGQGRAVGRVALQLVRRTELRGEDAADLLPFAMAATPDAGTQDSLLTSYALGLREAGRCVEATPVFRSALRRSLDPSLQVDARGGLAGCAFAEGQSTLLRDPSRAEEWFRAALAVDSTSEVGRLAFIGLGDARLAQGDLFGAAIAFQAAISASVVTDTIRSAAAARLNALASAPTADDHQPFTP